MHIRWVRAVAFGALADKTLHLSDGLNVVVGPNDSGKSTWHAAMYAALCGIPPEPSAEDLVQDEQTRADRRFRRQRRPRRLHGWAVEAEVDFDHNRRLVLRQNLRQPATSTATVPDGAPNVDGVAELSYEGGIDAARLLGLNRRSYAATAWVSQDRPRLYDDESSREELQRVIGEYIGDEAALRACQRIRAYRRDQMGTDSDPHRPLGIAVAQAQRRREDRDQARLLEQRRIRAEQDLARARSELSELEHRLRIADALAARARVKHVAAAAQRLRIDIERLQSELARLRGTQVPPNDLSAAVLKFPGYVDKGGTTARGSLPGAPGTSTPADPLGVVGARAQTEQALRTEADVHTEPDPHTEPDHTDLEPKTEPEPRTKPEVRTKPDLGTTLSALPSTTDVPTVEFAGLRGAAKRLGFTPAPPVRVADITGRMSLGGLENLPYQGLFLAGLVLASIGLGLSVILHSVLGVVLAVTAGILALGGLVAGVVIVRRRERELPPSPPPEIFDTPSHTMYDTPAHTIFDKPVAEDEPPATIPVVPAQLPAQRGQSPVERRPADEERVAREIRRVEEMITEKQRHLATTQQEQTQAEQEARGQAEGLNPYDLYTMDDDLDAALGAREAGQDAVARAAVVVRDAEHEVDAVSRQMRQQFISLAGAESALDEAQRHVTLLRERDRLMAEALEHLTTAVSVAREKITAGVETRLREYLPEITHNRHSIVEVDPQLRVRVGDQSQPMDDPTPASRGTVEQTHLLRLVALGRHLGYGHEAGPLLLDDITSNADRMRMVRIMDLLHRISQQRQVVVFTHEDSVENWAKRRRNGDPRLRLHRLESVDRAPVNVFEEVPAP